MMKPIQGLWCSNWNGVGFDKRRTGNDSCACGTAVMSNGIFMTNLDHIMPNAQVVPILWGYDYIANPTTASLVDR